MLSPASSRWVANEWRSVCGVTCFLILAAALAVADVEESARAVDVADLERAGLRDAQPGAVGGRDDGPMLDGVDGAEQPLDLVERQDVGQLAPAVARPGDPGDHLGAPKRDRV